MKQKNVDLKIAIARSENAKIQPYLIRVRAFTKFTAADEDPVCRKRLSIFSRAPEVPPTAHAGALKIPILPEQKNL